MPEICVDDTHHSRIRSNYLLSKIFPKFPYLPIITKYLCICRNWFTLRLWQHIGRDNGRITQIKKLTLLHTYVKSKKNKIDVTFLSQTNGSVNRSRYLYPNKHSEVVDGCILTYGSPFIHSLNNS